MENTSGAGKIMIPVYALSEGVYLLRAAMENASVARKIKR